VALCTKMAKGNVWGDKIKWRKTCWRVILLRSESPSGKCAKLHAMAAASNNKDHMPLSLYYRLFVPHIYGCYSSRTSRSWWITHSTQCQPRGCNNMQQFNHSYLRSVRLPSGVFTRNAVAVRTAKGNCWCGAGTKQNISVRNISNWHIFVS